MAGGLNQLAKYYRDILAAISHQSGKHLIDIGTILRYGLTVDLGVFVPTIEDILQSDQILIEVERSSAQKVSEIMTKSEHDDSADEDETPLPEVDPPKNAASTRILAIYRKQEQDRYNRETIIGFPLLAGKFKGKKFSAPLFYFPVHIEYDPLKSKVTLTKDFATPVFNSSLIAKLTTQEGEAEIIRQKVLPLLHEQDFDIATIEKTQAILSQLMNALRGLVKDFSALSPLQSALEARELNGAYSFNSICMVNATRSNAFLQDELLQLSEIEETDVETVVDTILSEVPESIIDGPSERRPGSSPLEPLFFPMLSNDAQRRIARKTERARLMVIQGPPGTGKSQTIANLVCDLVARGKSVLVTSHQNKALEVITDKLPQIDYLSMSMLKGEKESVTRLANQLSSVDAFVAGESQQNIEFKLKRAISEINSCDEDIHRLIARFSELKTLERDNYNHYFKYGKVKQYDFIDPADEIPTELEKVICDALTKWVQAYQFVVKREADYMSLYGLWEPGNVQRPQGIYSSLKKLLSLFEELVSLLRKPPVFVSKFTASADDFSS